MKKMVKIRHLILICLISFVCAWTLTPVSAAPIEIRDSIPCPFENQDAYYAVKSDELAPVFSETSIFDSTATMKTLLQDGVRVSCGIGIQGYTISYSAGSTAEPAVSHPWMYVQAALIHDSFPDHVEDSAPVDQGYNVVSVYSQDSYTVPAGTYYVIGCHQGQFPSGTTYHTHTQSDIVSIT